ncbi:MAG: tetratricopeptide repeat protein [Fidelibacterota bacterium]|nr:MAG: tetratricopeptide repeat protein [Candidatus Neomarinimicrobiota bacterium]
MIPSDLARYHLERAIELDPDNAAPRYHLALYLKEQGLVQEAIIHLRHAVEVAMRGAEAFASRAVEYGESHQYDRAKRYLLRSKEERTLSALASYELGLILMSGGQNNEAEEQFTHAVESDPTHADTYYQLGRIELEKGREREARDLFEEAVEMDFTHARAHIELACLIPSDEDKKTAENHYLIALDLDESLKRNDLEKRFG